MKHNNNDPGPPLVEGDGVLFAAMMMSACLAVGFAVGVFAIVQQWWFGGGQ
jgi:hypothetical protein